jgi:sulfatase maturation enzyme AslB (radical SAM superfamily)
VTANAGAGEAFVERLTLRPTLACNFSCKYCNEYSPHYAPSQAQPPEAVLRDFDRALELIDRIRILEVSGGEPLMYRPLPQVLRHLAQYSGRFEFFSLVTNGSIGFGDEVLPALRDMGPKVRVILDDYGPSLSRHAQANAELLAAHTIRYELRDQYANVHSDGWLDFNDLSLKHDEEAAKRLFAQCVCPQKLRWVVTLHRGRLYPCHVLRRCTELGIVPEDPRECINIHDKNLTDGEIRANIVGLYGLDVLSACRYCAGFVEGRERIVPAEQRPRN